MFHVVWYQYALTGGYQLTLLSLSQSVGNYVYGYLVKQFLKHVVLRCYPSVHNQSVPVLTNPLKYGNSTCSS